MSPGVARLQLIIAAALFSTGGAAIKATALGPWPVACLRSALAGAVLWLALPGWRKLTLSTCLVGVAYGATMILFVTANKLTTSANAIFLQSTAPIHLLWLSPWLLGEHARRRDLLFTAALAVGLLCFFVGAEAPLRTAPSPVAGNIVAVFCGLTWALTILGLRWLGAGSDPAAAGAAVIAGNFLAALVAAPWLAPIAHAGFTDWLVLGYLGVFQIALAYVFVTRGMGGVTALEASLLFMLEPVLNALWSWWIHGEFPGAWSAVGCAIILLATVVNTASATQRR